MDNNNGYLTPYLALKHRVPVVNGEGKKFLFNHNKSGVLKINYKYFHDEIKTIKNFIPGIPNGIYTWIIKTNNKFYAARTQEGQEIGTLHTNLAALTKGGNKIQDILAAG